MGAADLFEICKRSRREEPWGAASRDRLADGAEKKRVRGRAETPVFDATGK